MLSAGERPQPAIGKNAAAARTKSSLSHSPAPMWSVQPKPEQVQHIWVVTGPAGCGKSTVGRGLQAALNVPFLEGDDFHSQKNKEKMGSGIPLTDADRWDWLISLRNAAIKALSPSEENNFHPPSGVVVACSALKQKYRDVMRVAAYGTPSVQIHFVYLKLDEKALLQRVAARQAHYMKSTMVQSQLQDLEEPQGEWDALTIDAHVPQEQVMREVLEAVSDKLAEYQ
ncbi:P-loop containing nucleoside triphosphate hydrolase protein [Aspergillus pseudonomiae]|uniref:Gluconokinase n=1 Tax=Aspergillus pseudonomiae TaxID=1506151 RepID=A0A5N6HWI9_9EURO|nr:P-loop containing nucleoside triphosphate hydrolase protein [Aspergillus pseudonomiae]KAB8258224.1 P-loop containing nucleoside triphosphate hydrolase protein [Aspergillus pseudonomiae]KAE8404028.1 P-loop containing nucleoside triphosphate hydrolase protein [Aspergillus pseudonomiae]